MIQKIDFEKQILMIFDPTYSIKKTFLTEKTIRINKVIFDVEN